MHHQYKIQCINRFIIKVNKNFNREIQVVIEVLLQILKSGYIKLSDIGILTPYDAQKRRIRNEINLQAKVINDNILSNLREG